MAKDRRYVVVCGHILRRVHPIRRAVRDEPQDPADSGWQALCGVVDHSADPTPDGGLVSMEDLLRMSPELREWIDAEPPITLERESRSAPWRIAE